MILSKTEKTVYEIALPIAEAQGCYIYDVEFVKEGAYWFLRVFVDKENEGATLDDCEGISRAVSAELDKKDLIEKNYYLEVATPGIDRRLKQKEHFERYIGFDVEIGFFKQVNGNKNITATLQGYDDGIITVNYENENIKLNQKDTAYVRLAFDFTGKKGS